MDLPDTPHKPTYVGAIVLVRHPAGNPPVPAIVVGLHQDPYWIDVRVVAGPDAHGDTPLKLLRNHPPLSSEHPYGWSWPLENLTLMAGEYVRDEVLIERGVLPPKVPA